MQDAGGIDAIDDTIVQYNSSSHQAAMLKLAESHKQDSLPVLHPGQLCRNVLAAMHLVQLVPAICLIKLHHKLSLLMTLHNLACKQVSQECV